jgi:hypothetical protein
MLHSAALGSCSVPLWCIGCGPTGDPPPLLCRWSCSSSPSSGCSFSAWLVVEVAVTLQAHGGLLAKFEVCLPAKSLLWFIRADNDGNLVGAWSWEIHLFSAVSLLWIRAKALQFWCLLWAPIFLVEGRKGNLPLLVLWQLLGLVGTLVVLVLIPPVSVVPSWCWSSCEHARLHFSSAPATLPVLCVSVCVVFVCLPLVPPVKIWFTWTHIAIGCKVL